LRDTNHGEEAGFAGPYNGGGGLRPPTGGGREAGAYGRPEAEGGSIQRRIEKLLDGWTPPANLLLGAASSGYQCEGGFNGDPAREPQNNLWSFERRRLCEPSGPGTRFWDARWKDDLDLTRAMGLNAFRMGIEWARLYPSGARAPGERPALDSAALDHYAEIIHGAQARGLEPVVTLHHFTHPGWAGEDLWLRDNGAEAYLAYVAEIVPALNRALLARGGRTVKWWVTLNEPNALLLATYLTGFLPSNGKGGVGLTGLRHFVEAADRLYAAHVHAYGLIHRVYREQNWPSPSVGLNHLLTDAYGLDRAVLDVLGARLRGIDEPKGLAAEMRGRALAFDDKLASVRRAGRRGIGRGLAGVLRPLVRAWVRPEKLPRLWRAVRESPHDCTLDYLGLDLYDPLLQDHLWPPMDGGPLKCWTWRHYPESLYDAAFLYAEAVPGRPVFVLENGMATELSSAAHAPAARPPPRPRDDGWTRDRFLREHFLTFLEALRDGAPLVGYLHWAISDNYEWGSYSPRFGLHAVDLHDPERPRLPLDATGVDAASAYRAIATALLAGRRRGSPADGRRPEAGASVDNRRIFEALSRQPAADTPHHDKVVQNRPRNVVGSPAVSSAEE
jgi:beta-glucosidase/6-phospho-beta-glucosidase/beta-galactosidase